MNRSMGPGHSREGRSTAFLRQIPELYVSPRMRRPRSPWFTFGECSGYEGRACYSERSPGFERLNPMHWIVLTLLAFAPPAAPTAKPLDQEGVNRLVQQLSSPRQQDREQAEAELAGASPDVLDLLPRSTRDAAASIALERVRRSLEKSAARRAGLASTVSLEGQRSPEDIEAAILR